MFRSAKRSPYLGCICPATNMNGRGLSIQSAETLQCQRITDWRRIEGNHVLQSLRPRPFQTLFEITATLNRSALEGYWHLRSRVVGFAEFKEALPR